MLQNLQVMRAVAALLVVIHHFLLINHDSGHGGIANFRYLAELGACGVDLFFCISGFVMLGSIAKKASFSASEFAIGRIIRIVPVYWVATTLFIALVALNNIMKSGFDAAMAGPLFSPNYILSSYLLIPNYNPISNAIQPFLVQGWTLSYELYFYALLMCAAVIAKGRSVRIVVLGSLFLACGMLSKSLGGVAGEFLSNSIVLEFVMGMLIFLIARRTKAFGGTAVVLGLAFLAATAFLKVENRVILWGIPAAFVLYGFVALEGAIPVPKLFKAIGDASYSLYLTHGVLTYVYGGLIKKGWFASATKQNMAVLVGSVAAVLVAFMFYRFVERPLLERFNQKRLSNRRVPAV